MATFDWSKLGPFVQTVKSAAGAGALAMGKVVESNIKASFTRAGRFDSGPVGAPPAIKRGQLRNSIATEKIGDMAVKVGSNVRYGAIHEYGGRITARNVKFLPVPVNDAAKRLHETKGMQSLRAYPMRLIRPMFGKQALLVGDAGVRTQFYATDASGKRRTVVRKDQPVFVLKKFVDMPKRPFVAPALARARNNPTLVTAFSVGMTTALRRAGLTAKVVPA
jgi:phage gpG-like protein